MKTVAEMRENSKHGLRMGFESPRRHRTRWVRLATILLTCHGWVAAEQSDPEPGSEQDAAIAESLFHQGRQAAEAHRWDEACAKFEASLRLVRTLGTLANLGWCHESQGRTASAWAVYRDLQVAASDKGDARREQFASERLQALEDRLPKIRIVVDHPPEGLLVRFGRRTLERGAWNCAIPVDPGSIRLRAEAPGHEPQDWTVDVTDKSGTVETRVPKLRLTVDKPAKKQVKQTPSVTSTDADDDTLAYALAGTAVLALGIGAYAGVMTFAKKTEGDDHCTGSFCDETGLEAHAASQRYANVSTVSIGLALLLGGTSTWLFASESRGSSSTAFGPASGSDAYVLRLGAVF